MDQMTRRAAGGVFGAGGAALFVTGLLHPQGEHGGTFHNTTAAFLQDPKWPAAHWLAISAVLPVACALWLLIDDGWTHESRLARAGGRLLLIALPFMAVEFAVEIASESAADAYAAGQVVPLVNLTEPMQAVGFPAMSLGFAALALGLRSAAPRPLAILGAVGGVVTGIGAPLVMGLHIAALGPTFIGLALPTLWMVWAGARLAIGSRRPVGEPVATAGAA